jgi:hypothetical protein
VCHRMHGLRSNKKRVLARRMRKAQHDAHQQEEIQL